MCQEELQQYYNDINTKEWSIYLKNSKKKSDKFLCYKNWLFHLFFFTSANRMIISEFHHLNFSLNILRNKKKWSLYFKKGEKKSHKFLKYRNHFSLFCKI
jgi:hypothetical protein